MSFDVNNQYTGTFFGKDRLGHTTPDPDGSEWLRPFLPVPYPAPWLPGKRRDEGHPVGAQVVLSAGHLVGLDKSGALIPGGLMSGSTGNGGPSCAIKYSADDVGFAFNPKTGVKVAAAGESVLLACATDAAAPLTVDGVEYDAAAITWAKACDLIPGGVARPVGYAIRNVFQYLGGVSVTATTKGMAYGLNGVTPVGKNGASFAVHNYMHEPGTAVQTMMILHLPWIGKDLAQLAALATAAGITGYTFSDYAKSFVHFVGDAGAGAGKLYRGCAVVASNLLGDYGNFKPYDKSADDADMIIGRVIGIENIYPIRDYADRVRTQFDRAAGLVGPFADRNPSTFMMGGSATRGLDYAINISTNGLLRKLIDAGATEIPAEAASYIWVSVNTTK